MWASRILETKRRRPRGNKKITCNLEVVDNHGDRKSPKWGSGTPSKLAYKCFINGGLLTILTKLSKLGWPSLQQITAKSWWLDFGKGFLPLVLSKHWFTSGVKWRLQGSHRFPSLKMEEICLHVFTHCYRVWNCPYLSSLFSEKKKLNSLIDLIVMVCPWEL